MVRMKASTKSRRRAPPRGLSSPFCFHCSCCSMFTFTVFLMVVTMALIPTYIFLHGVFATPTDAPFSLSASKAATLGAPLRDFAVEKEAFEAMDDEWMRSLAHAPISMQVQLAHMGLAKKYVFVLDDGKLAMAKPMERDLLFYPRTVFSTLDWFEEKPSRAVRMDREYQGWGELGGLYLDRELGFYRKPPIAGRYVSSDILYSQDYSYLGRLLYALPTRQVPVSMHAWVKGLSTRPPSLRIGKYLTLNDTSPVTASTRESMLEYSDVIVFDFLLDDYDRFGNHNWKASADRKLLAWDSGLALNYGPGSGTEGQAKQVGRETGLTVAVNLDILCGTHQWNKMDPVETPHYVERKGCKRVCVFRRHTMEKLKTLQLNNKRGGEGLGARLRRRMELDSLYPIFEYGVYHMKRSAGLWWLFPSATRFEEQNFFDGLDLRVEALLEHVDHCIASYGIENVLLDEL